LVWLRRELDRTPFDAVLADRAAAQLGHGSKEITSVSTASPTKITADTAAMTCMPLVKASRAESSNAPATGPGSWPETDTAPAMLSCAASTPAGTSTWPR
jgi:hypothetical protein